MSSYDQNLLDEAPKATRAQLQGYNVDLLEQPPRRTPSMRTPAPQTPYPQSRTPVPLPLTPGIPETNSKEKFSSPAYTSKSAEPTRTSFWRTRNGIITIAILILVVVGAAVGGAVGGTVGKKTSSKAVTPSSSAASKSTSAPSTTTPSPPSTGSGGSGNQGTGINGPSAGVATTGVFKAQSTAGSVQSDQNIVD
ncbi:hypothetical protein JVU11DRAFT_8754 [Chiua virens]|nr:hypothetical protein JVU11DRAFT_8754 [Chiua virens]